MQQKQIYIKYYILLMFKIIHYLIVYSRNIDKKRKKKRRQMLSIIRDMIHWFFRVF
jgi:hypothetical protein